MGSAIRYLMCVCVDSHVHPSSVPPPLSLLHFYTSHRAGSSTMRGVRTDGSPIHPQGELILGQWDEWTVFCQVGIGFSTAAWALTKKGPPGDNGDLEAHEQDMEGKKGGEEWGQFGCTRGRSHGTDHHCPMAPSVFWGPGQPLGWADWGLAWQWGPRA